MRTVQTVGLVAIALCGCASGSHKPGEQDVDATTVDTANPDQRIDAAPPVDARPPVDAPPPDAPVVLPPDACVASAFEKLTNPVFDLTPNGVGWTGVREPELAQYPFISADPAGVTPHSPPNKAWFGGAAGDDIGKSSVTDSLYQDVTIPASATQVTITGYYLVGTNETGTTVYDTFSLDITQTNGTVIENILTANNTTVATAFTQFSKTLTANVAGQTIRLRATSTNDVLYHTNFFLDSLSLKATHCP